MRHIWLIGLVLACLGTVCWVINLFNVTWISQSQSTHISLRQGCFTMWACSSGDWNIYDPGLNPMRFDFSIRPFEYLPKVQANNVIYVPAQRQTVASTGSIMAKAIHGYYIVVPLYLIVFVGLALMAMAYPSQLRRKRRLRGHCERCGYDLRSSPGLCPECGTARTA
jgi:hypothetical protein